jgi:hypothetical protein
MTGDQSESYDDAIVTLTAVLDALEEPGMGLNSVYGLRYGDWAYKKVAHARNELAGVRDAMKSMECEVTRLRQANAALWPDRKDQ